MPTRRSGGGDAAEFMWRLVERYGARSPLGGPMTPALKARLMAQCGKHATDSAYECSFYRRDLAPLPGLVDRVFRTLPDVVVRPPSAEEVAAVVALAGRAGTAITVRAGASTSHGGCLPVRGGVVLDMSALNGTVSLDEETSTACVRAGTVWTALERRLAEHDLAPLAVPSSAPASTVGGWLSTMGFGIGSLKYGPFVEHVRSAEVVLADGSVRRVTRETDPPLDWLAASEGTLGVVTEIELRVRPKRAMRHALVACADMPVACELVALLAAATPTPYALHFDDHHVLEALDSLGYLPADRRGGELVRVDWEGGPQELHAAEVVTEETVAAVRGARRLPAEAAQQEWGERFRALRIKRGGPSVLGAELLLPLSEVAGYVSDTEVLAGEQRTTFMTYGHVASPTTAVVMTMYYADETELVGYLLDLGLVKSLYDIGAAHEGIPYGLGLWNAPHLRSWLAPVSPAESLRRKRELDAGGIMNPGKGIARLALMNPFTLRSGMGALAGLRRVSGRGLR